MSISLAGAGLEEWKAALAAHDRGRKRDWPDEGILVTLDLASLRRVVAALERIARVEAAAQKVVRWHYRHSVIAAMDDMISLRAALESKP